MASQKRANSPAPHHLSFGTIARIMGWAPGGFIGFEGGFFPTPRLPVLLVHGQQNAVDACEGLNCRLSTHPLSPRFAWLPASTFARHERLNIETSIREAQRGELPGDKAGNVHWVARQAATLGESLSRTGKPCYVFFRFFPHVHGPLPLESFVMLPDEEIGAAIEAEAQRWAAKNKKLIAERSRKLKKQSARRTGGPPHRESPVFLDGTIGGGTAEPEVTGPRVVLHGPGEPPIVDGRTMPALTNAQHDVISALLKASPKGLTKDALDRQSCHGDGRRILKRLANKAPEWKAVISFPGSTGKGYRIL